MLVAQQVLSVCPGCGASVGCTANEQCWCMNMPAILPVSADLNERACLCQTCLSKKLAEKLTLLIANTPHHELLELAARYRTPANQQAALQEHLDFSMEDGLMVFSAWYHLKRGTCCGNGCRHCPYPK